jgi:hypothetical protein
MYHGGGNYRENTRLTYQAECGYLVGLWLLELSAEETARMMWIELAVCMSVLQLDVCLSVLQLALCFSVL